MRVNPSMQKLLSSSLAVKALLLLVLVSSTVCHAVSVGEPAPFFQLEGAENKIYRLEDFKDKIVFVNFWASWCPPCRKELPLLDQLQSRYDNLVVLAINIDDDREAAQQFIEQYNIKSLILYDPNIEVVSRYKAIAMPTSYILDEKGIIRYSHYGFSAKSDPAKWDEEITSLLVESP